MDKKAVAYAVADWLNAEAAAASAAGDADKSETLEMAAVSVSAAYGLDEDEGGDNVNSALARFTPLEDVLARGARATATVAAPPPSAPVDPAVREKAEKIKNEGNELMGKGDTHGAVKKYTEAIALCNAIPGFYGNRAAAYARLGLHEDAIRDCDHATRIDPLYSKGFGRKGMSLKALGRTAEARAAFTRARELDPGCAQYTEALADLPAAPSTPFAALLESNPSLRGVADSLLASERVSQVAGLLGGMQRGSGAASGTAATANSAQGASTLIDSLSSTADAVMRNPQLSGLLEALLEGTTGTGGGAAAAAGGERSQGTPAAGVQATAAAQQATAAAQQARASLAAMMQGLLGATEGGDGGGVVDLAHSLLSQLTAEDGTATPPRAAATPQEGASAAGDSAAATRVPAAAAAAAPDVAGSGGVTEMYPTTAPPKPK